MQYYLTEENQRVLQIGKLTWTTSNLTVSEELNAYYE